MDTLTIQHPRRTMIYLLSGSALFLILGFNVGGAVRLISIGLCGLGIVIALRELLGAPRLRIDERGVFDRTMGVGIIPWSEITGVYMGHIERGDDWTDFPIICLALRQPDQWWPRLSFVRRRLRPQNGWLGTPFWIDLSGFDVPTDNVFQFLVRRYREVSQDDPNSADRSSRIDTNG